MARSMLVAYGTKHGSTREVAEAIAETLREQGLAAEAISAGEVRDLAPYDAVVVGGSLCMGRWHPDALRLLRRKRESLAAKPLAVFALGPKTAEADDLAASREQLEHNLEKVHGLEPQAMAVFGGVIDPRELRFPLDRLPASDARDWDAVRAWACELAGLAAGLPEPDRARALVG